MISRAQTSLIAPFVLLDACGTPYYVAPWGKNAVWFVFYWHADKRWVTYRKVTDATELESYRRYAISDEMAQPYHDLHERNYE